MSDFYVELRASGYDWWCPDCDMEHHVIELSDEVECPETGKRYRVGDCYQAYEG